MVLVYKIKKGKPSVDNLPFNLTTKTKLINNQKPYERNACASHLT